MVLEDGRVTTQNPFASASHQEAHQVLKRENQLRLIDWGGNTQDKQEERERKTRVKKEEAGRENARMHRDTWRALKEKIATLDSNRVCNI